MSRSRTLAENLRPTGPQVVTSKLKICPPDTSWMDQKFCMISHSILSQENASVLVRQSSRSMYMRLITFRSGTHWKRKGAESPSRFPWKTLTISQSTLMFSLLCGILTEGTVYYDGIPINTLNLDAIRSNITIIPQVVSEYVAASCQLDNRKPSLA
jgi:hypothetical protein